MEKWIKLILLCVLGLGLSATSYADRFYLGAGAGYNRLNYPFHGQATPGVSFLNISGSNKSGGVGQVFLGYSHCFGNNIYGAAELDYWGYGNSRNRNTIAVNASGVNRTATIDSKLKRAYGFSVKPGYYISRNILLFGDFGYLRGRLNSRFNVAFSNGSATLTGVQSNGVTGLHYGAGAEINVSRQFGIRAEYEHIRFNEYGFDLPDTTIPARFRPKVDQAIVSIVYTFGSGLL